MSTGNGAANQGLFLGVAAATLWGMSFVIPAMLPGWSSLEITLGRYFSYAALSVVLYRRGRRCGFPPLGWAVWRSAFFLGLSGYMLAYLLLVESIQLIGPAVPALIMGTSPVSVALYGNLRRREYPFLRLALPLALIFAGLAALNVARHGLHLASGEASAAPVLLGLGLSLASLGCLTWYLVANLMFLKDHPEIRPIHWASVVGIVLGLMSAALLPVALASAPPPGPRDLTAFAAGSLVLGLVASWGGGALWNRACAMLPASLAGQLIVFWPLSGLALAYLLEGRLPGLAETAGIALTLAGVVLGIRRSRA